ncbi:hypothetical protein [Rossellomorea aquimaris]|uniref:hypothetical protein n=1 Tax=Rossellomorea aquimaris TaxID=189382 RepID=UPI001CFEF426|nr:hypothetical protein [Rossellomorea aquimaris]
MSQILDYLNKRQDSIKKLIDLINAEVKEIKRLEQWISAEEKYIADIENEISKKKGMTLDEFTSADQDIIVSLNNIQDHQIELKPIKKLQKEREDSLQLLSGALLQAAKQAISIEFKNLNNISTSDLVKNSSLKLEEIIWSGRNQSLHWEEGWFAEQTVNTFKQLSKEFSEIDEVPLKGNNSTRISESDRKSYAFEIVSKVLQWDDYNKFKNNMKSIR